MNAKKMTMAVLLLAALMLAFSGQSYAFQPCGTRPADLEDSKLHLLYKLNTSDARTSATMAEVEKTLKNGTVSTH